MENKLLLLVRRLPKIFLKFLPVISFIIPISILYYLRPDSFQGTWEGSWQGRFLYLFFLWLCFLEIIIGYERLSLFQLNKRSLGRVFTLAIFISLPTVYIIAANFFGLNETIKNLAERNMVYHARLMPLSIEYMVFSVLLCATVASAYGIVGLEEFSISITFLGVVGLTYAIDELYPVGRFTPFQSLVFPTTNLAQSVLNFLGYPTSLNVIKSNDYGYYPVLLVFDPANPAKLVANFGIAWPCAGVESLIIYALTILLFLKKSLIPTWQKVIYFAVGAVITYLINVLRIVSIFLVKINGGDWLLFHNLYGPLYSVIWITTYPLIIVGSRILWNTIKQLRRTQHYDKI